MHVINYLTFLFLQQSFDRKQDTGNTRTDTNHFPSILQHPLGNFYGREFGEREILEKTKPNQTVTIHPNNSISGRAILQTTSGNPQIINKASQSSTSHPRRVNLYASHNPVFQADENMPGQITQTRYPEHYQMTGQQSYPTGNHLERNQYSHYSIPHEQTTSPKRKIIDEERYGGLKSSFAPLYSSNGLSRDQDNIFVATENNKSGQHQRSVSLQPTRSELKLISGRRQSENVDFKRTSEQQQQLLHTQEPFQRL